MPPAAIQMPACIIVSVIVSSPLRVNLLFHHGEQVFEDLQDAWARRHNQHGRQYEKENRKDQFDAHLAGALLGFLAARACA